MVSAQPRDGHLGTRGRSRVCAVLTPRRVLRAGRNGLLRPHGNSHRMTSSSPTSTKPAPSSSPSIRPRPPSKRRSRPLRRSRTSAGSCSRMRFERMTDGPSWFVEAIDHDPTEHVVEVDGTDIRYLSWGTRGKPGLVFVHGGAAHAQWWSFIAPLFAKDWHAVAIHLSGHGDSGRRAHYSHKLWAREVMAVVEDAGFPGPPVIVGHSLGGMVTIQTAATFGDRPCGCRDRGCTGAQTSTRGGGRAIRSGIQEPRRVRHRSSRPFPISGWCHPNRLKHAFIIDWIARSTRSTKRQQAGRGSSTRRSSGKRSFPCATNCASVRCRVALFTGELSVVVPPDTAEYMYELMGRVAPVIPIPRGTSPPHARPAARIRGGAAYTCWPTGTTRLPSAGPEGCRRMSTT